jgi:hypothetical protein
MHRRHLLTDVAREIKKIKEKQAYRKANDEEDGSPLLQPPTRPPGGGKEGDRDGQI